MTRHETTGGADATQHGLTLQARFSTNEIMEFLKSVAAVSGRLVTSVMLSLPSGHIPFSTGLELGRRETTHARQSGSSEDQSTGQGFKEFMAFGLGLGLGHFLLLPS